MPVVAVGAAIFAGVTIAEVGIGAMSLWAIIGSAGAITAGVGAVTGNKDLIKIGAVMGIVGGVGALATSTGAMGTAAEAAAGAAEATPAGAVAQQAMQGAAPVTPAADAAGAVSSAAPEVASAAAAAAATDAAVAAAPAAVSSAAPAGIVNAAVPPVPLPTTDASFFSAIKDFSKPMVDFAQKNQLLTYGMMQVGGSFMQGLFKEPTELEKEQAALARQRADNMAAPLPTATSAPRRDVYGNTTRPVYTGPGILNTVTGRPA